MIVDIVTGATQGIGRAIAEHIAFQRSLELQAASSSFSSYALVLVGRNVQRGTQSAQTIQKSTGLSVLFEPCDQSQWDDVVNLKQRIAQRAAGPGDDYLTVGILVNNAAECPQRQQLVERMQQVNDTSKQLATVDKQFASNVLGYHFMIKAFQDHYKPYSLDSSSPQRDEEQDNSCSAATKRTTHIVNVASNWAGDLDLEDLQFQRRSYDNDSAYRQSKQCDRMLSHTWSQKLSDVAVVNSCHPGDPCTTLSKALGYNLWSAPPSRAMIESESPIPFLCGFGKTPVTTTGGWFEGSSTKPRQCRFARMTRESQRLFDICESFATSSSSSD